MPLVPAKCPSCGGDIQVDNSRKEAFCSYCGTKFLVESAVNYYNTKNEYHIEHADIRMEDSNGLETRLKNAETHLVKHRAYDKAAALFKDITDNYADDWRAWWGVARSLSHEFTGINNAYFGHTMHLSDNDWHVFEAYCQENGFEAFDLADHQTERVWLGCLKDHALTVAPADKKRMIEEIWEPYAKKVADCEARMEEIGEDFEKCRALLKEKAHCKPGKFFHGSYDRRIAELDGEIDRLKSKYSGLEINDYIWWPTSGTYVEAGDRSYEGSRPSGFHTFEEWGV